MPPLAVWLIRGALVHLVLATLMGALFMVSRGLGVWGEVWVLRPIHIHVAIVGWVLELVFGFAYWILPRLGSGTLGGKQGYTRGRLWAVRLSGVLIHLSVVVACLGAFGIEQAGAVASAMGLAAGLFFVVHAWPRVKPFTR